MATAMRTADFHFELPESLIAQRPTSKRTASRLLVLGGGDGGGPAHSRFGELPRWLRSGDLLVLNDTRVIPARLYARKETGGRVEIMLERVLSERRCLAQLKASKTPRTGSRLLLEGTSSLAVIGRRGEFFELDAGPAEDLQTVLDRHGHMPLPPYIQRPDDAVDQERYQTVYARHPGAVAAPTAGLHFDRDLLGVLADLGVGHTHITLHVGAGTFQPVRTERVEAHTMHTESVRIRPDTAEAILRTRHAGGRIVAVGTTSLRALETAAADRPFGPWEGESSIFIYPGFQFRVVDLLISNFHLPGSSLMMLVTAFGGYRRVMDAYREAVRRDYRFFSYGDAMLLDRGASEDLPPSVGES